MRAKAQRRQQFANHRHIDSLAIVVTSNHDRRFAVKSHVFQQATIAAVVQQHVRLVILFAYLSIRPDERQRTLETVICCFCRTFFKAFPIVLLYLKSVSYAST